MHIKNIKTAGKAVEEAQKVLIMLHGRGGSAADILSLAQHLNVQDYALLAPQATDNTWYPQSFMASPQQNEPWLSSALQLLKDIEEGLNAQGITSDKIYFSGFSQGACLTLEYVTRNAKKYGGVAAFTGGLAGDKIYMENYKGNFKKTPVFIGTGDPDPHVPLERVNASSELMQSMNADVNVKVYKNRAHSISRDEINMADNLIFY